jgi:glutamyl endopeptidase
MKREHIQAALLAAAVLFVSAPARPQTAAEGEEAAAAQHTPVASDGAEVAVVKSTEPSGESGSEGTGELPPAPAAAETAEEVWNLWALSPTTSGVGIETIIGPDERVRVNPTTTYPARAVVLITFTGGRCSGWLYGPNVVATAGHCVHSGGSGGAWKTNVRVFPGRNGASSPYGSCTAKRLHSVTGWTQSKSERYDYGAIKLNCNIGSTVGWFGYWWQAASLKGQPTRISGYPGDKPLEQWRSDKSVGVSQARQIFYQNDTLGGMSGSGVVANRPAGSPFCVGQCSMGIHAYGLHGAVPHSNNNHGTRIVQAVFDNLKAWKDAP